MDFDATTDERAPLLLRSASAVRRGAIALTAGIAIAVIAACSNPGNPGTGGDDPSPLRLAASQDLDDRVRLSWELPVGAAPRSIRVQRDGTELKALPGDSTSFDDLSAEPGSLEPPTGLAAEANDHAVSVSWQTPTSRAGREYAYSLVADYSAGGQAVSEPVRGRRSAPIVDELRLFRDGAELARIPATETAYVDMTAAAGSVQAPALSSLEALPEAIALAWTSSAPAAGAKHAYYLDAISAMGASRSEPLEAGRSAPTIIGWQLARDGETLASLEVSETSFLDRTASPGSLAAPLVQIEEREDSVVLSWLPSEVRPGRLHRYAIAALTTLGPSAWSPERSANREAPDVTAYRVLRDGVELGIVDTLFYRDEEAEPGELVPPSLIVDPREEAVGLSWAPPVATAGRAYRYEVVALSAVTSSASEPATAGRAAPRILGWKVFRDHERIAELGPDETSFDDEGATAGAIDAPTGLVASQGTQADSVTLQWNPAASRSGLAHLYRVVARSAFGETTPSDERSGARTAPAIAGYELQRDGRAWLAIGDVTTYDDTDAPKGSVVVPAPYPVPDRVRGFIELRLTANPSVTPPAPSQYRVRAVAASSVGSASAPVSGFRRVGTNVQIQWQRSAADADADYSDLPRAVLTTAIDLDPPTSGSRYYRASFVGEGAQGVTPAVRAMGNAFSVVSSGESHSCAVRLDGQVFCWGSNTYGQAPRQPSTATFTSVSAGARHSCGLRSDGKVICWGRNDWGRLPRRRAWIPSPA
ncbi:RCC1 domain-containing protein [Vulgatibacter incomptus]|nr:RCC1 domain-containing protein [Vulgatibacter incomptus]